MALPLANKKSLLLQKKESPVLQFHSCHGYSRWGWMGVSLTTVVFILLLNDKTSGKKPSNIVVFIYLSNYDTATTKKK